MKKIGDCPGVIRRHWTTERVAIAPYHDSGSVPYIFRKVAAIANVTEELR
jgi:hypothetical protein